MGHRHLLMRAALGCLAIAMACPAGGAGMEPARSVFSGSRHFLVQDGRGHANGRGYAGVVGDIVQLRPETLAVSVERILAAFEREFHPAARRNRPIRLVLRDSIAEGSDIVIFSKWFTDGWEYVIEVPERVKSQKLIHAVVQTLLKELANSDAHPRSAEIPLWLMAGLSARMEAGGRADLIVDAPPVGMVYHIVRDVEGADRVRVVRERLASTGPVSFAELSFPSAGLLATNWGQYEASAHLFFHHLVAMDPQRRQFLSMLRQLPSYWNWQMAFMAGFEQFDRLLDVEKWWSLVTTEFTLRDTRRVWIAETALKTLEDILTRPLRIQYATNELPFHAETNLQAVISTWDFAVQRRVLEPAVAELAGLQGHAPPEVGALVQDYMMCLHEYLAQRISPRSQPQLQRVASGLAVQSVVRQTLNRLDALDRRRAAFLRDGAPG